MDSKQKARYILEHNSIMVLSTADASGKPWISPVGFAYDNNYNFYWVSYKEAVHSKNIQSRPEVALVVFGPLPEGDLDGVYIDAKASELKDEVEIQSIIELFAKQRPQPVKFTTQSMADVTGQAAWRMYKAIPVNIYKRADDTAHGQAITVREAVSL